MQAELNWNKEMQFTCNNSGLISTIDATKDFGGNDAGPTPKELILNAMMGCTAMDVIAMLKKMRQIPIEFKMKIEVEKTKHHPVHFKNAELFFYLNGVLQPDKIIKAVESSLTKYCGVNYMIAKSCQIKFKIFLNNQMIKDGPVEFIEPQKDE